MLHVISIEFLITLALTITLFATLLAVAANGRSPATRHFENNVVPLRRHR